MGRGNGPMRYMIEIRALLALRDGHEALGLVHRRDGRRE